MDTVAMINILSKNKKFKKLFEEKNKKFLNEFIVKINKISQSQGLFHNSLGYFCCQNDILRYVELVKAYAKTPTYKGKYDAYMIDKNLLVDNPEEVLVNDTLEFYQHLDELTENKHNLLAKVLFKLQEVTFIKNSIDSSVGRSDDKWYIKISTDPYVFNRLAMIHEMWHSIDEKFLLHKGRQSDANFVRLDYPNKIREAHMIAETVARGGKAKDMLEKDIDEFYDDQFVDEIGTLFMEKLTKDYLLEKYSDDKELCQNLRKLDFMYKNTHIHYAREAYLDHLIAMAIAGSRKGIRMYANKEIVSQCGKLWTLRKLLTKVDQLYELAETDSKFYPMYHFRYAIGNAIADEIYTKYLNACEIQDNDKRAKAVCKLLDKVVNLNDNDYNVYKLKAKNSTAKNKIDIITEYFNLDRLEKLLNAKSKEVGTLNIINNSLEGL